MNESWLNDLSPTYHAVWSLTGNVRNIVDQCGKVVEVHIDLLIEGCAVGVCWSRSRAGIQGAEGRVATIILAHLLHKGFL